LLLFLHVLLGEGLSVFGITLPIHYLRNFALVGFPFFALGLFVKKYECKFKNVPNYMIFVFIIIGALETVISRSFLGENELYVGSLFVLVALVCVFIKCANVKYPPFLLALEGCSTYIYIFHIMISSVICITYGVVGIDMYSSAILENLHPVIVCIGSTVFSYVLIKTLKHIKKIKKQRSAHNTKGE
jgi:hypothetical protein